MAPNDSRGRHQDLARFHAQPGGHLFRCPESSGQALFSRARVGAPGIDDDGPSLGRIFEGLLTIPNRRGAEQIFGEDPRGPGRPVGPEEGQIFLSGFG